MSSLLHYILRNSVKREKEYMDLENDKLKLDSWAKKLLDTGKRNNLVNYKERKGASAEIVAPDIHDLFSKCQSNHVFEVFDPHFVEEDTDDLEIEEVENEEPSSDKEHKLTKVEFIEKYFNRLNRDKQLLVYSPSLDPVRAVSSIQKKSQSILDETGINVGYLAFGFIRWNESIDSKVFYKAPLLLVHVTINSGTITDPVKISIEDDDIFVNPTFRFLAKGDQNIDIPDYDQDESLDDYISNVSILIKKLGWSIVEECRLDTFSFLKINMYEDLTQNIDKILKNGNVKALLGDAEPNVANVNLSEENLNIENDLVDLHTVVDADSSQIEAIEMAKTGKSFVLQGPPGTGKSQTITNIIAECLHDGKKILFVSEKQAALNVVYNNLKKVDLQDFCLELHSYKANKKAVIAELMRTVETPATQVSSKVNSEIREKVESQKQLDRYAEALHKKRDVIEHSLYELYEKFAAVREYPEVKTKIKDISTKGEDYLLSCEKLLSQYAGFVSTIGQDYHKNAWYGYANVALSFDERSELHENFKALFDGLSKILSLSSDFRKKYGLSTLEYHDLPKWHALLQLLGKSSVITPLDIHKDAIANILPHVTHMQELSNGIIPLVDGLTENYNEQFLTEIDGQSIHDDLISKYGSFFKRIFNSEYKKILTDFKLHQKSPEKIGYQKAVSLSTNLMNLQELKKQFESEEKLVEGSIGTSYQGYRTDWNYVLNEMNSCMDLLKDTDNLGILPELSLIQLQEKQEEFCKDSDEIENAFKPVFVLYQKISGQFENDEINADIVGTKKAIGKAKACLDHFDELENWIQFRKLLNSLKKLNISDYVDETIKKKIETEQIVKTFTRSFYDQWIKNIIFSDSALSHFSRISQDQAVDIFSKKDIAQFEISKIQIKSELSQKRPNLSLVAGGSPVAILRREAVKKRKIMPIRTLISQTWDLVKTIKPCFLMSPLSVSTFLDPNIVEFDTIIFDEASQIFPEDAIGAIYRGKQLIVVGDSKQMPPSNFFNASIDVDDEEVGDIGDFESILDICSSVFTTKRLAWHYRSHYEQLIAFSNLHFYNNTLVTFPSSCQDHEGIGVDYYYTDGIFDRKSKTNLKEASYIVDLVYKNIEKYPDRSLGVVAFSVAQQNLIDRLLSKKRETDPSKEWFFNSDSHEPFFIKNLETVQGDERDTIIFSVAYAKDAGGRFIQNFGPVNREGGERRLNVAFTRAKDNIQLVASIHATDINITSTQSTGVNLLRAYLDYAEHGGIALDRSLTVNSEDQFDSDFEVEVCDFLRENGFTVDTQVGCSGYRIDMGLRKPNSSQYVLAIECDGATYHSGKNARDRDRLRQQVLERMGWKFYRIWSTDWFKNRSVEQKRLMEAASKALNGEGESKDTTNSIKEETPAIDVDKYVTEINSKQNIFPLFHQRNAQIIFRGSFSYDQTPIPWSFRTGIKKLIQEEGPVSEESLLKRIVYLFGREKVTKAVLSSYEYAMFGCESDGIVRKDGFLYMEDMKIEFHVPGDKRDIKYISSEEIADGMLRLIEQNASVPIDSLYKKIGELQQISRTGSKLTEKCDTAVNYLLTNNKIIKNDNVVSLNSKGI